MEMKLGFRDILNFFQSKQTSIPGDPDYNSAFCHYLVTATHAEEGSIWQLDDHGQLHLVYSTDIAHDQQSQFSLREGEGVAGAVALTREAISVSDAWGHPYHDRRIDDRLNFRTRSMVSAPILFGDLLYGVVNILNHTLGGSFPPEWKERLSAVGVIYGAALAGAGRLTRYGTSQKIETHKKRLNSGLFKSTITIVGISPAIQEGLDLCLKAAKTDIPILILGETGTGKELAARRTHEASDRARGPFLAINCAAVTDTIIESELFGHVKGAFTGAIHDRQGKFLAASGGTIFLDEIGDMPLASQAKILRTLEEKKVTPVGSEKTIDVNTRIIAATNHDLAKMIDQGRFREDLFYRLCGIEIHMPPLRERTEDIQPLAMYFLNKAIAVRMKKNRYQKPLRLSKEALELLLSFDWPGNIRQLEQAISAATAICDGTEIKTGDFPTWFNNAIKLIRQIKIKTPVKDVSHDEPITLVTNEHFSNEDRVWYQKVLESTKYPGTGRWNVSAAARNLGIPRKTLAYRLKKLGFIR